MFSDCRFLSKPTVGFFVTGLCILMFGLIFDMDGYNILDFLRGRETFETRAMDASTFNLGLDEGKTASGKSVDAGTAVQASTVYACVSLIADSVATMPVHSYRKTGDFREQTTAPAWMNATDSMPNPETDRFTWIHRTISSLALYGNSYWLIVERDNLGFPKRYIIFILSMSLLTETLRKLSIPMMEKSYKRYTTLTPDGDIVHIKNFEQGSDYGLSPIEAGAEAIGISLLVMNLLEGSFLMELCLVVLLKWTLHQVKNH